MAALLGADIEKATALAEAAAEGEVCTVANDNDPTQVVLSGHKGAIDRAVALVKEHGIKRGVLLPVSAPFHCPLMQPAADAMAEALDKIPPAALRVALFANVTAAVVTDPAEVKRLLVEQVTGRVRWRESVIAMRDAGVEQFVELGGKVLGPMINRTVDVSVTSVIGMADIEALAKDLGDPGSRHRRRSARTNIMEQSMEHRLFDLTGMTALLPAPRRHRVGDLSCAGAAGRAAGAVGHQSRQAAAFREELNDTYGDDHVCLVRSSNTEQVEHLVPAASIRWASWISRQQCRDHARQPGHADEGRGMGRGHPSTSKPRSA
jgi:acyl transferase domain-containing protein